MGGGEKTGRKLSCVVDMLSTVHPSTVTIMYTVLTQAKGSNFVNKLKNILERAVKYIQINLLSLINTVEIVEPIPHLLEFLSKQLYLHQNQHLLHLLSPNF